MDESETAIAGRIGGVMRRCRVARGWSQAVLAERLDVSVDYVGLLERGERLPSLPVLIQIANEFGVSTAELLGEPTPETWEQEALVLLRALPIETRDVVVGMLKGAAAVASEAKPITKRRSRSRR